MTQMPRKFSEFLCGSARLRKVWLLTARKRVRFSYPHAVMTWDQPADRAIDRFYQLQDIDPRNCRHGIMLVGNVLYQVTIDSVSRTGKTVYFRCNDEPGSARRDNIGEWLTENEPHYPIRFVPAESNAGE